jgi:predicted RNA-binding Zn-ribbon protein involved in translation (DUF1610 family)
VSADRDVLNTLEARIADQDATIAGLKRQIDAVHHIALDAQRATNTLASLHGSLTIVCPDCGTSHLASSAYRTHGVWYLICRHCGVVPWRARLS